MIRELKVKPPRVINDFSPTQQTDVYMYGSLLYELFTETPSFRGYNSHTIIYQIGKGILPEVQNVQCAQAIKVRLLSNLFCSPLFISQKILECHGRDPLLIITKRVTSGWCINC